MKLFRNPLDSDVPKEPHFFEKPLRDSRIFRYALIETVFIAAYGTLLLATFWNVLPAITLFLLAATVLGVASPLLATIRNHRHLSEILKQSPAETVRREALNLAAAQAQFEPSRTRMVAFFMLLALLFSLGRNIDANTWIGKLRTYLNW
jgi:hypothetical protein